MNTTALSSSSIHNLSDRTLLHIFSFVPETELYPSLFVNSRWNRVILNPEFLAQRKSLSKKISKLFTYMCSCNLDFPAMRPQLEANAILYMTSIELGCLTNKHFSVRPWHILDHLKELRIYNGLFTNKDIKDLPQNLEVFSIFGDRKFTGLNFVDYPRNLKVIRLNKISESRAVVNLTGLPPTLTELFIGYNHKLDLESLRNLPQTLQKYTFWNQYKMKDKNLNDLPLSLRELNIRHSSSLKIPIFSPFTDLRRLALEDCRNIQDEFIKHLPTSLRELDLNGLKSLTDRAIFYSDKLRHLEVLKLSDLHIKGTQLAFLPYSIRELSLSHLSGFNPKNLSTLHNNNSITSLNLYLLHGSSELPLDTLPTTLRKLEIHHSFSGRHLHQLANYANLEKLNIFNISNFSSDVVNQLPDSLKELHFELGGEKLSKAELKGLKRLNRLTKLSTLDLTICEMNLNPRLICALPDTIRYLILAYGGKTNLKEKHVAHFPPHLLQINLPLKYKSTLKLILPELYQRFPHLKVKGRTN